MKFRPSTARSRTSASVGRMGGSSNSMVRPLSARTGLSRQSSTISTLATQPLGIEGKAVRPSSALTITDTNMFGFWFYKCPQSGALPYTHPKYTIPKCKSKSFLDGVQKRAKNTPAPNSYKKELSWKGKNALMKGPKRITIIDKIRVEKKPIPGPSHYKNLNIKQKIQNGKFNKTTGLSFLSEVEFLGKTQPGPTKYENKKAVVLERKPAWKFPNPKQKTHWKPKKVKGPDPGTYEHHTSIKHTSSMKKIAVALPFGGNKGAGLSTKEKMKAGWKDKAYYLQKGVMDKKFIPGVGHYK